MPLIRNNYFTICSRCEYCKGERCGQGSKKSQALQLNIYYWINILWWLQRNYCSLSNTIKKIIYRASCLANVSWHSLIYHIWYHTHPQHEMLIVNPDKGQIHPTSARKCKFLHLAYSLLLLTTSLSSLLSRLVPWGHLQLCSLLSRLLQPPFCWSLDTYIPHIQSTQMQPLNLCSSSVNLTTLSPANNSWNDLPLSLLQSPPSPHSDPIQRHNGVKARRDTKPKKAFQHSKLTPQLGSPVDLALSVRSVGTRSVFICVLYRTEHIICT